jgi:FG-GAP-like repeat
LSQSSTLACGDCERIRVVCDHNPMIAIAILGRINAKRSPSHETPVGARPANAAVVSTPLMRLALLLVLLAGCHPAGTSASMMFHQIVEARRLGHFAIGIALADLNRDGLVDLIASSGGESAAQSVTVTYNRAGDPTPLAKSPDWYSGDIGFNAGLSVGDIDGDGFLDVAVAMAQDLSGNTTGGGVAIYMNHGGTLDRHPLPRIGSYGTAGCKLADIDGDGELDLVVPVLTNEQQVMVPPQERSPAEQRIYLNHDGVIDSQPSWTSTEKMRATDVVAADLNQDGWMDLAFGTENIYIYYGRPGSPGSVALPRTADWVSYEKSPSFSGLDAGRLGTPKGPLLLGVASGCIGEVCDSRFMLYRPTSSNHSVWTTPARRAVDAQRLLFADVDQDGRTDLLTIDAGRERSLNEVRPGGPLAVFRGAGSTFVVPPAYVSPKRFSMPFASVAIADIRNHHIDPSKPRHQLFPCAGGPVLTLDVLPQAIDSVMLVITDGGTARRSRLRYAWAAGSRAVSMRPQNAEHCQIDVGFLASPEVDVAVSVQEPALGSPLLFFHN